jgi:hypothetical protein
MTEDRKRELAPDVRDPQQEKDWDRTNWAGSVSDKPATPDDKRWNKTEWVGNHGEGMPAPVDPAQMPEGETSISGNRHGSGEQHWADRAETDPREVDPDQPAPYDPARTGDQPRRD